MADDVEVPVAAESGTMDSESRADAALAMFNNDTVADSATPSQEDAAGQDAAQGQPQPDVAEKPADGQITDEQFFADPRYQQVSAFKDEVEPILGQYGIPDSKELSAQLSDSAVLYQIMAGKAQPSALLDFMAQNAGWSPEQKSGVAQDIIGWLTKAGYLKDGAAPQAKQADPKFNDPLAKDVADLKKQLADRDAQAQQSQQEQYQQKVFQTFETKLTDFASQKNVAKEDIPYYINQVSALIGGNKAIIGRIEKGNFVDVQRLFTQVHNAEVKRMERFTQTQLRAQGNKQNNPKIPASGAPPAPAGQARAKALTRDERIAAAAEQL